MPEIPQFSACPNFRLTSSQTRDYGRYTHAEPKEKQYPRGAAVSRTVLYSTPVIKLTGSEHIFGSFFAELVPNQSPMIRSLLEIVAKQPARQSEIQRVSLVDPLQRFDDSAFGRFKPFKPLARAIAKNTNIMVESLLSDDAVPDWRRVGNHATQQQIADLSIFCSDCLVQFAINDVKALSTLGQLNASLIADIIDLVRLMFGDFARGETAGRLTFVESLASRDINDPQDILFLTRFLDQLLNIPHTPKNSQREAKIQNLQKLFDEHRRAFAYTLHSVLTC